MKHTVVWIAGRAFSVLCLAIVIGVPLGFIIIFAQNHFRLNPGLDWLMGLYRPPLLPYFFVIFAVPVGLGMDIWRDWNISTKKIIVGLRAGLLLGAWFTTLIITVDYLGFYPNIIGALIGVLISGSQNFGLGFWMSIYLTNLLLWPLVGMALVWLVQRGIANQG